MIGLCVLACRHSAAPDEILKPQAQSSYAKDGDSIDMQLPGGARRIIRLHGVDAPELHQTCATAAGPQWPCGAMAQKTLVALLRGAALTCNVSAQDQFGRSLATCASADMPDIGAYMVRNGWAVSGVEKSGSRWENGGPYLLEQAQAQKEKRGIWQGEFMRPADWRVANPR